MATLKWLILCERAVVEQQTGSLSMVALVENIAMPSPPPELAEKGQIAVPFRFYAVQHWARSELNEEEQPQARMLMIGPNGKDLAHNEYLVDLRLHPKANVIGQSMGFPLVGEGAYKCRVQVKTGSKWRTLGESEFRVTYVRPPLTPPH